MNDPRQSNNPAAASRRHAAFTLIELLVVIAIIALLVGILLPALSAARRSSRSTVCLANVRRLATSTAMYQHQSAGRFPPFRLQTANGVTYVNEYDREKPRWQWFIAIDIGPVINPPTHTTGPWGDAVTRTMTNNYFMCPSFDGPYEKDIRNGAYGYNYQYLGNSRTDTAPPGFDNFPVSDHRLKAPGQTVLFADSRGADPEHGKHSYALDPPRLATEKNAARFGPGTNDGPIQHSPAEARHDGLASVAFADAHAKSMSPRDLGYEVGTDGVVVPDLTGGNVATNRLWNGFGEDPARR